MQASRRAFLGAGRPGRPPAIRPPWAIAEAAFVESCSRCDACVKACPTSLLRRGDGGFPEADFTPGRAPDGCTFCGDCVNACRDAALQRTPDARPWNLFAVIGDACLTEHNVVCRTCGEACETAVIRFTPAPGGVSRPQVTADCSGCGACLADCPTQAIKLLSLPDSHFLALRGAA